MATSTAHLTTVHGSKYLQQLCKHFGHKVPLEFTPTEGRVDLPFGACRFTADDQSLHMTVEGEGAALSRLEQFVGSHLERFAFR